jgi:polysaccharide transporter, PST family
MTRVPALFSAGVARNAGSLYAIQIASYVLPMASFPYLTRVLGPERYGIYVLVLAVARYGLILTDWGFNYSATRELSVTGPGLAASKVYSATVVARVLLLCGCAILLLILTSTVPRFEQDALLYWVGFLGVVGSAFIPIWLYQAFQRVSVVTITLLASRVGTTILIFLVVHGAGDVSRLVALWSAPWLITAAVAMNAAPRLFGIRVSMPSRLAVFHALRDGSHLFASAFAATLYTAMSAIMLGLLSSDREVGYFGAAETMILAAIGLIGPLSQALFPSAAQAGAAGRESATAHLAKTLPLITGLGAVLSIGALVLAPLLGQLVFGPAFEKSVRILQIMSPIPVTVAVSTALVTQLMLPLRMDRAYSRAVVTGAILSLAMTALLVPRFGAVGTAFAVTVAEMSVLTTVIVTLRRHGYSVRSVLARS